MTLDPVQEPRRLHGLQVRGPFRGAGGYDQLVREWVRALLAQKTPLQLIDIKDWYPLHWPDAEPDSVLEGLARPVEASISLQVCMPPQVKKKRGFRLVNYTMFEADRVPRQWIRCNKRHDLVILPHDGCVQAWTDGGFPADRIRKCPQGVDAERFHPQQLALPLPAVDDRDVSSFQFRFLHVADYMPRKNLVGLLRIWLQVTRPADDAVLICKINCSAARWKKKLAADLAKAQALAGVGWGQAAPILFLHNWILPPADMPRLFACATHYWSMSFGEGWDLPMMEAAASGLQLIAPDHSAYQTYLDKEIAWLIPSRPVPAVFEWDRPTERLFRGSRWWQPDLSLGSDMLRDILDHDRHTPESARERVKNHYSWAQSAEQLRTILVELA